MPNDVKVIWRSLDLDGVTYQIEQRHETLQIQPAKLQMQMEQHLRQPGPDFLYSAKLNTAIALFLRHSLTQDQTDGDVFPA